MRNIYFLAVVVFSLVISPKPAQALVVVGDISDFLNFSVEGLETDAPINYPTGVTINGIQQFSTIDKFLTVQYGSSLDLVTTIANVTGQTLQLVLSNPPTAIDPNVADIILGGQNTRQIPINSHFGGALFSFVGLQGGNGTLISLGVGEAVSYTFGYFDSTNLILDGNLSDVLFIFDRFAQQSVAYDNSQNRKEFLLNEPFAVRFVSPSVAIPEPSTFLILVLGLLGFAVQHRGT